MSSTLHPTPRSPAWIACRGELRRITNGKVDCPDAGTAVRPGSCPTCRWLEDAADDRFTAWTCSAETATESGRQPDPLPAESGGALMIELL